MKEILKARHAQGIFDDKMYKDGVDRVDRYQDGIVVAQTFLKFLLEE